MSLTVSSLPSPNAHSEDPCCRLEKMFLDLSRSCVFYTRKNLPGKHLFLNNKFFLIHVRA
jgi:hypothetical protein